MILGLDISTTIVGAALLDNDGNLILSEHWDISKAESLFEKGEIVGAELYSLRSEYDIDEVFIETALKKFLPGKSRADTIIKLAKFTARSLYGLSFPRGTKGPQRKKMVIEAVKEKEKTSFRIEMARGGKNYKKGTDDRADAVVIVRAGEFLLRNKNNEGYLTEKIALLN